MLFTDATALIALGEMGFVDLLRHFDSDVVIGQAVESEVRRAQAQLVAARKAGWLRVESGDVGLIETVQKETNLDAGEADTIVLVAERGGHSPKILVDERRAFRYLAEAVGRGRIAINLVCLAQVLHHLEESGHLGSASVVMRTMLDHRYYAWAPNVRGHYEEWCRRHDKAPVP